MSLVFALDFQKRSAAPTSKIPVRPRRCCLNFACRVEPDTATTIGLLLNPTNAVAEIQSKDLQAAARTLGLQLRIANASTERDFDAAFATLSQGQVGGLVIGTDGFLVSQSEQLAALTVRYALPTIFQYRAFFTAGGLMS